MSEFVPVPAAFAAATLVDRARYEADYQRSVEDNEGWWAEQAARLDWSAPFETVKDVSYAPTTCTSAGTPAGTSTRATTPSTATWRTAWATGARSCSSPTSPTASAK